MHTAHHMLLFGCQVPADMAFSRDGKFWYEIQLIITAESLTDLENDSNPLRINIYTVKTRV